MQRQYRHRAETAQRQSRDDSVDALQRQGRRSGSGRNMVETELRQRVEKEMAETMQRQCRHNVETAHRQCINIA